MSIFFGDGTHSKRDPRHCTLDFYTKVQVWGRVVKISLQSSIHTNGHLGLKKWRRQLYLAIKNNYYKKWIMIKKRKYMEKKREREYVNKERKEKKGKELQDGCSSSRPLLSSRLMIYTHHLCVWFKPCWSPELDHVQPSNCCSNYEAPSICCR
jgi:hypothetical protein